MIERRTILKGAVAALTTSLFTGRIKGANDRIATAHIGVGAMGSNNLGYALNLPDVEPVAVCDVYQPTLEKAVAKARQAGKTVKAVKDFREILADKSIDAVCISTPDHWHAYMTIEACKQGKDVFVEKPASVYVEEGQKMVQAARKYKRVVQIGTQRRSTPHLIEAREQIIKEGKLGKIGLVEIYCYYHMRARENPPDTTPPDNLDYEMWTGPAPMRTYNKLVHPRSWRAFMEYGNGIVGDMCIHMLDMVRWMLDLGWPQRISSSGGILVDKTSKANISDTQTATFEFDGLPVIWTHRTYGTSPDPDYPWGATIYGDKGTLKASVMSYDFIPQGKGEKIHKDVTYEYEQYPEDKTEKDLERHVAPAIRGHMKDLLRCMASRTRPVADIEQGYISSASSILANVSMKLGRSLTWDAATARVVGDEEANRHLSRPYRAPWVHPHPGMV